MPSYILTFTIIVNDCLTGHASWHFTWITKSFMLSPIFSLPGQKGRDGVQHISWIELSPLRTILPNFRYSFMVVVGIRKTKTKGEERTRKYCECTQLLNTAVSLGGGCLATFALQGVTGTVVPLGCCYINVQVK